MPFKNREQAAFLLAEQLEEYRGKNPLILAIPRGAAPIAKLIAQELQGEFDVVLVRKLRAPNQPEFAIGSIDEAGHVYLNPNAGWLHLSPSYVEREKEEQLETLRRRRKLYTPHRPPIDPQNRIVMIVDDGIATGSTMIAALQSVRAQNPSQLIAVTAVAPPDSLRRISEFADRVVCLEVPKYFQAVGQFFQDFSQVSDKEVIEILSARGSFQSTTG